MVNECINNAKTKEEFLSDMEREGYEVEFGKFARNITFIFPDKRRIRNYYLLELSQDDLSTEGIRQRLNMPSLADERRIG